MGWIPQCLLERVEAVMVFVAWMFESLLGYPKLFVAPLFEFGGGVVVEVLLLLVYSECVLWGVDGGVCFFVLQYPAGVQVCL